MHFPGSIVVPESATDPLGCYANNTANSLILIEACRDAGVSRLIFSIHGSGLRHPGPNPGA